MTTSPLSVVIQLFLLTSACLVAMSTHTPIALATDAHAVMTLTGHQGEIVWVGVSPDGKTIVSAGGGVMGSPPAELTFWSAEHGTVLHRPTGHTKSLIRGAFSPDGRKLATAAWDGQVHVWDVATGKSLSSFQVDARKVADVAFSPDGTMIASSGADGRIKLWRADNGKSLGEFNKHANGTANAIRFLDEKTFLSAGIDKKITVWGSDSRTVDRSWTIETPFCFDLAISPDGKYVAAPSAFETVTVFEIATGKKVREFQLDGFFAFSVAFSPNGKYLVASSGEAGESGEIKVWDVASGEQAVKFPALPDVVYYVAFTPDGRLVSSCANKTITIWDLGLRTADDELARSAVEQNERKQQGSPDVGLMVPAHVPPLVQRQINNAFTIHRAYGGKMPETSDEYMREIIQKNNIRLPKLPSGKRFEWSPIFHHLTIVDDE